MYTLNFNHLMYLKTIVDQGSIIKAAQILKIGSPAISMQIKQFEENLGIQLFVRANKKLSLTKSGEVVYEYAKEISRLGSEMLNTINDQFTGELKIQIGIQDCVPKNLISSLTSYIYDNYNAVITVVSGDLEYITLKVLKNEIDVGLLNYPPIIKDKGILFFKRILNSEVVIAGSKEYLKYKNKDLKQFEGLPFILPSVQSALRHKIEHYFEQKKIKLHKIAESEDTVVQKNMAISGNGVIVMMRQAIEKYLETKQLYVLKELSPIHDEIWIIGGKRKIQNPIEKQLLDEFYF